MQRIIFYSPFSDINSPEQYQEMVELVEKRGVSLANLPLAYDGNARVILKAKNPFKAYRQHIDQLNGLREHQIEEFQRRLSKKGENADFLSLDCPIEPQNKKKLFFSEYTSMDTLFIHAHGNPAVIGAGGFILDPEDLAINLEKLGLSKKNCPIIVVWSCNSGTTDEDFEKSYAERLRVELKNAGYQKLGVIGISAKILTNRQTKKDPLSYCREEGEKLKESTVFESFLSPGGDDPEKTGTEGVLTNIKRTRETIHPTKKTQAIPINLDDDDSTERSSTNPASRTSPSLTPGFSRYQAEGGRIPLKKQKMDDSQTPAANTRSRKKPGS